MAARVVTPWLGMGATEGTGVAVRVPVQAAMVVRVEQRLGELGEPVEPGVRALERVARGATGSMEEMGAPRRETTATTVPSVADARPRHDAQSTLRLNSSLPDRPSSA